MDRIASFSVDHTKFGSGFYVSRIDGDITTFDMRTRTPNSGDYMDNITMHTLEHLFATFVRGGRLSKDVIYFGPMGCQTGFYLLMRNADYDTVLAEVKNILSKIISYEGEVFGASEIECGNYRSLDLNSAKEEAKRYYDVLEENTQHPHYYEEEEK